jgi:uncharacterized protein
LSGNNALIFFCKNTLQSVLNLYIISMEFEWDENKNLANIKNHEGISFEDATKVFDDIWAIDEDDFAHSTFNEKRFTIIGMADTKILRVSYKIVSDQPEVIRIISVRKAKGMDKQNYEQARNKLN